MFRPPRVPIVGVGASAGGIEALEGFFRGLPPEPGLAFVIVTHLSPDRESVLHEIIQRFTDLKVAVAADGVRVDRDRVYVLPSNAIVSIVEGCLVIRRPSAVRRERKPIDIFFGALSRDQGEYAAGVVLSGADGDGTLGIKAIRQRGGLTLAQVPDGFGPRNTEMPDSAISTGFVDFAVPAEEMGARLASFARSLAQMDAEGAEGGEESEERHRTAQELAGARPEICRILRGQVGHDFSGYKPKTFVRRVQRRMQVLQLRTVEDYLGRLRQDPVEVSDLFRDLLITVTNFFRDSEAFESLAAQVVPKLFAGRDPADAIRIWIPGCATGEEVYSIAILLREHMDTLDSAPRVQIFATDIDEHALGVARSARYPEQLLDSVSDERRARFFLQEGGTFVLVKEVRELCIFSPHSVLRDPPFSRLDLISCRNLLIYLAGDAQSQVLPTFHYALRPGGYLFLGMSENASLYADLFVPLDKRRRIFQARQDGAAALRLPAVVASRNLPVGPADIRPRRSISGNITMRHAIETQVLERFAPAHVVVNRDGDVVYYSPRLGKYLEPAPGMPTRQILTMARKGLRLDLRSAFREAVEESRTVHRFNLAVEGDDAQIQMVTLTIDPLGDQRPGEEPLFLILFIDEGAALSREALASRSLPLQSGMVAEQARELNETRERLQSLIEEYEAALEELKSSNEELVAVNEELQSTNEELEASKEELQAVNEELHTVNAELSGKVEALDRANSDLQNLFESTDVATVFLDANLVIRSFTPAVITVMNVLPSDRGRPITDLATRLDLSQLAQDVSTVMRDGTLIERRIDVAEEAAHYLVRLRPYRDTEAVIEGVVVTFIDITTLTQAEMRQEVMVAELQHRTRNLLGVVQSIAGQTLGRGPASATFMNRLKALGRVQALLSRSAEMRIAIGTLVRMELDALLTDGAHDRVSLDGPEVFIRAAIVQTLSLALHELATNARKYGAFANDTGRLRVSWTVVRARDEHRLVIAWSETEIARIEPAPGGSGGYGRELIERALPYALGAKTRYELGGDALLCTIDIPLIPSPPDAAS